MEDEADDYHLALKHFILAARAGHNKSLGAVKNGYMDGIVTKDEFAYPKYHLH